MASDLSSRMPKISEVDLSGLNDWEKKRISSVMEKAQELQKKDEDKALRQKMEGQLSKWTNLMKGWQYRWFVLNAETGYLEYYVDKGKKVHGTEPRGSVHLMGAVIAPSDEDSVTFTVNASNGDLFKLRACDARERQQWINNIRMISEKHSAKLVNKVQLSNQTVGPANTTPLLTTKPVNNLTISTSASGDNFDVILNKNRPIAVSSEVLDYMEILNELLNTSEAQQMAFLNKIEAMPNDGETVNLLSREMLLIKATSQTTLHCLHQCFVILQKQIDDVHDVARHSGIPEDATIQWFDPPKPKSDLCNEYANGEVSKGVPLLPASSGSVSSTNKKTFPCSNDDYVDGVDFESLLRDEIEDGDLDEQEYSLENENIEEHKSLILHLLSKLKLGMDLTKVSLPTFILEPRSLLEMFADCYGYPQLFLKITDETSPRDRMLAAVEYYLTSFYAARKGRYSKKPYNPILGEVFHCCWDISAPKTNGHVTEMESTGESRRDYRLRYVAEQVSHHPPVSAFYVECPEKNICMNSHVWTKSKFYGMSVGVELIGNGVLTLLDHDEEYFFTFPNAYCRSILTRPWYELGGKVSIACPKTGYNCSITFHTKPMYGGIKNHITGEVKHLPSDRTLCRINGQWTDRIEMDFSEEVRLISEKTKVIEPYLLKKTPKKLRPIVKQDENESRRLWRHVTEAVRCDDINIAAEEKEKLEDNQRLLAKQREESGHVWTTTLFHEHRGKWLYNHHLCFRRAASQRGEKKR
ncbi:oxysterol-binding protein-related protein 11-like [Xenia sp. Carnegie-2017]|uniref:oxysterol-binding protein-related protein 11-like n=1 Tax=Xenia sp. Carnegie-2017 TaxID=2897299 RepID=UPI001F03F6AB|nr:oxysterol-binding protein-related protein 11-like [Xenia sp. Carnegie-2017]XP_046860518.1 oxysterol-binding protein-related protein 11-like [Xenia sp. Carnegie-2017]XP_046860519.1 oxysterol-binding protein-related protein 11-like [Xenia sp. Carnegie-2017]XP_046860520.1 oxysterol-binding protein-related protein 11-like [Xenia sp. Carnegie-2017]